VSKKKWVPDVVKTLVASGFVLKNVTQKPNYLAFDVYRVDEFGVKWNYLLVFSAGGTITSSDVNGLSKVASNNGASVVIIGRAETTRKDIPVITMRDFTGRMGGLIPSFLPLEPTYAEQLTTLGLNKLPKGLTGKADDLFEAYVHSGLQFILQDKVVRYGQERLFEVVPDGLVLGRSSFQLLYDCKAAKDGYDISRDSIRQFADYVSDFHKRYEGYVGRLHAFLLVSGKFQSEDTLETRSGELFSECQVPLVYLKAEELGKIVALFAERPSLRQSIDWRVIFSARFISAAAVKKNIQARVRDKVIT
jgi:hypothetical protein